MAVFKLYSKQRKAQSEKTDDGYRYDLPTPLRVQIVHILEEMPSVHQPLAGDKERMYREVHDILCREYGVFGLKKTDEGETCRATLLNSFLKNESIDECLDIVQVLFGICHDKVKTFIPASVKDPTSVAATFFGPSITTFRQSVDELNHRFREHNVGYQLVDGQIIRIDSEIAHQQITLPALKFLKQDYLKGADEEFLCALEHHRHGRFKECLNECLKAFESTMKSICHKRGWPYNQNDTAKSLIKICEDNKLFPAFMESQMAALRTMLESGIPTARNKASGHGQGATPIKVSEELASYVLYTTGSTIRLFAESEQRLK